MHRCKAVRFFCAAPQGAVKKYTQKEAFFISRLCLRRAGNWMALDLQG